MGESLKIFIIFFDIKEYHKREFMNMICVLTSLQGIEIAKERMRIIKFYEELKREGFPIIFHIREYQR